MAWVDRNAYTTAFADGAMANDLEAFVPSLFSLYKVIITMKDALGFVIEYANELAHASNFSGAVFVAGYQLMFKNELHGHTCARVTPSLVFLSISLCSCKPPL